MNISTRWSAVLRRSMCVVTLVGSGAFVGCTAPPPAKPLVEALTVRVASAHSTQSVRFTMDVTGGQAAFRTPELRGQAGEPRLTASTPAELVLGPGTTSASFHGLDGAAARNRRGHASGPPRGRRSPRSDRLDRGRSLDSGLLAQCVPAWQQPNVRWNCRAILGSGFAVMVRTRP